jgi:hypothetical protein
MIYGEYIRKTYFPEETVDFEYFSGNENGIMTVDWSRCNTNTILFDYNDGVVGYRKSLSELNKKIKFDGIDSPSYTHREPKSDVFSFNLKTTTDVRFDEELLYWTEVLTQFKSDYGGQMFFVSGNKKMKREMCHRFEVPFLDFESENKFSHREGGELQRGSSTSVMIDLQNCVNTNFVSLERLVMEYGVTFFKPKELFKSGKAEKFDLLVEFFKENHVLSTECSPMVISVGNVT